MNLLQKAIFYLSQGYSGPLGLFGDVPDYGSHTSISGETVTPSTTLGLSAVWGCVNLLAGTIASLPVDVRRRGRDGLLVQASDHPLYMVLHESPNADQTALDFWEFIVVSLELWGNAYARVERMGNRVVALMPLRPDSVGVKRADNGDIEYRWHEDSREVVVTQDEMFHVRGFGGGPLGGYSTLSFGASAFGLAQSQNRAASTTFRNGLRAAGVMQFDRKLDAEQRALIETHLASRFSGDNAGGPLILEAGTTWQPLSINPNDAQMLESRAFSVEEICRFFGVPPFMVGHTEKSTSWGTGLEQQLLGFQKFTLRRRLKRIEQSIKKQLLTPVERANYDIEFNLEALLRADTAARATFYNAGVTNGWLTVNEVRAHENLPPVAGGEVPRVQMQNVALIESARGAE